MRPTWLRRDVIRATADWEHDAVRHAQLVLRCPITGEMDDITITHIRGIQMLFGIPVSGILDEATAEEIDRLRWVEDSANEESSPEA